MDFRRIEWIFLVIFLALDIFLGVSFYQSQKVELSVSKAPTTQMITEIKRDQITLPELNNKTPKGAYIASRPNTLLYQNMRQLQGQSVSFDSNHQVLTSNLTPTVAVKKGEEVATIEKWMKSNRNVLFGSEYVYSKRLSSKNIYAFAQHFKEGAIYDDRAMLYVRVEGNRVMGYTQMYTAQPEILRDGIKLVSNEDAVIELYRDNDILNNSKVLWTKLGYTWLLDAKGSSVYVPAWFVGIENRNSRNVTVKKINAITKAVIKTPNQ